MKGSEETPHRLAVGGGRAIQGEAERTGALLGPLLFDALLQPHRSLSPSGFIVVMLTIGAVMLGLGIFFLLMGAWPVFGFLGLDLLLLWLAIKLNARALKIVERIRVTPEQVLVTRHGPRGGASWTFNPYWLNIAVNETARGKGEIHLSSHGFSLGLGAYLLPEERRQLADALRQALEELRRLR